MRWELCLAGDFSDETRRAYEEMNEGCVQRAELLDEAIGILERARG